MKHFLPEQLFRSGGVSDAELEKAVGEAARLRDALPGYGSSGAEHQHRKH